MGKLSLWEIIKDWIGGIGFGLFLWSSNMTLEQFSRAKYRDELRYIKETDRCLECGEEKGKKEGCYCLTCGRINGG